MPHTGVWKLPNGEGGVAQVVSVGAVQRDEDVEYLKNPDGSTTIVRRKERFVPIGSGYIWTCEQEKKVVKYS